MFSIVSKKRSLVGVMLLTAALAAGCSGGKPAQAPQSVEVKAMQVIQQDTPITYEFIGQVQPKTEAEIKANVAGNIVAKYVKGGSTVSKGQRLFAIDSRQYESNLLNAQAQLAQSEAALSNSRLETLRYKQLAEQQAIARQVLDTAVSTEQQHAAVVAANQAKVRQAENDLRDTVVISPIDGRMDVNELDIGNYVQAGQTVIATVSTEDPMLVQFSMSEMLYLQLARHHTDGDSVANGWGQKLKLILSDGSEYPLTGQLQQVDRGLTKNTGALTFKAEFSNPNRLLLPGMFARVIAQGEVRKGALLIPQRAVQELLGKTFVTIVGEGDKAEQREVKMGVRVGNLWMVESGLAAADRVLVEGAAKVQPGGALTVIMIGPDDLKTPVKQ
ncbi:MAG: efflux RND transporter periplasmic adaptor subunit [Sporomusaceae bacterium]|nr:efflux RND transporter periplasmic adaptor subunit [Sporomusaceae bacterium]